MPRTDYACVVVDDLPKHPCLALREVCHQPLSSRHGRRAVVMEKIAPYLDAPDAASANTNGSVRNRAEGIERIFAAYKQRVLSGEVCTETIVMEDVNVQMCLNSLRL